MEAPRVVLHGELAAGDRPQAGGLRGVGELERAAEVVVVRDRERVVAERDGAVDELVGA